MDSSHSTMPPAPVRAAENLAIAAVKHLPSLSLLPKGTIRSSLGQRREALSSRLVASATMQG